jgi:hypothetical protein
MDLGGLWVERTSLIGTVVTAVAGFVVEDERAKKGRKTEGGVSDFWSMAEGVYQFQGYG